ncbi:MAG TPA: response regulator [Longimicrobiales bacterium]|nr:response regulator [Longimicrobiales bacterium]
MSTKLVLMIEDSEHDREIYGRLLWYNNFDVICALDAEQGYWMAREARPDLILLDLGLPSGDGLDLCGRLRQEPAMAEIPVLVLSARPRVDYGRRAWEVGCACYLEKPIRPSDVLAEVERLIGPSTPPPRRAARPADFGAVPRAGGRGSLDVRPRRPPRRPGADAGPPATPPAAATLAAPPPAAPPPVAPPPAAPPPAATTPPAATPPAAIPPAATPPGPP